MAYPLTLVRGRAEQPESTPDRRIACELHDSVGQTLGALLLAIDVLEHERTERNARQMTRKVRLLAQRSLDELRAVMSLAAGEKILDPRPTRLDRLLSELALSGTVVHAVSDVDPFAMPPAVWACLLGVAEEALRNVRNHADARRVSLKMRYRDDHIELVVADNGGGFWSGRGQRSGCGRSGIRMMRRRAEELGGRLRVESVSGKGTRVTVSLPLEIAAD
jgi:signal transduction histidine kinase